jgi:Tol biopolymer transport system component
MTASDRFDRVFADVLTDLAQPSYPDYIDDALTRAMRGSQRPEWSFPERWLPMSAIARSVPLARGTPWRNLGLLAVLALLVAAFIAIAIGSAVRPAPPYGPAANGLIAYQLDGDIYARDGLTATPRLLVGGKDTDVAPLFSLDGLKLAFVRLDPATLGTATERASLLVAGVDGSSPRVLLGPALIDSFSWSPSGTELAVIAQVKGSQQLSIVPIDGSAPRVLELNLGLEGPVDWRAPDGRELIVTGTVDGRRFYAVRADGTGVRQITPSGVAVPPIGTRSMRPDGRQLIYMSMELPFSIRILDLDTGLDRRFGERLPGLSGGLSHAGNQYLSADGTKLVFGRYWDEQEGTINHQMWVASLDGDGSDAKPIGEVFRLPSGNDPFVIALAPDGSTVLVHRADTDESWTTDFSGAGLQPASFGNVFELNWQRKAP